MKFKRKKKRNEEENEENSTLKSEENANIKEENENSKFIELKNNYNKYILLLMTNKKALILILILILIYIFIIIILAYSFKPESKDKIGPKFYKRLLMTRGKIFWNNNTEINFTKIDEEISNYENMEPTFKNTKELYKRENPKISLILPVYNQEKYIKKIYTCIERQSLKDIEIVFVDDFSTDNSYQIIKELMNIDKRIVYIKNEENRGVFYTRNKGVISARGEYILLVDIDDYLLNDILLKSYETAKIYDLDIVHFYVLAGDFKKNVFWKVLKYRDGIIRGNIPVNNIFFKGTTRNTWDKLIRREVFLKSIDFMDEKYKTDKYVVYNDDVAMFGLFKVAESYGFLEEVGYIYNWAVPNSTTHKYEDKKYINDVFKSCFTIMEYYYKKTKDNGFEKRAGYYFFLDKVYKPYLKNIKYLTEGYDYVNKILDLYLNCIYLKEKHKKKLQEFKDEVIKVMPTNNSAHIFINSTNLT
jgi:glycosyltransferase involved in cell wall biosynthesis